MRHDHSETGTVTTSFHHRLIWLWMIPLMLLACWLGARRLGDDIFWRDEHWSMVFSGAASEHLSSPIEAVRIAVDALFERHTPGYYLVLNLWIQLVGRSEYATRALSLLTGLVALAWMYRLGRDVGQSPIVGISAAIFVGMTAFYVYHLHELRMYLLTLLLATVIMWTYWRWCSAGRWQIRYPILLIVATHLLVFIYAPSPIFLAGMGGYHLIFGRRQSNWRQVLAILALTAASLAVWYLPWWVLRAQHVLAEKQTINGMSAELLLLELAKQFSNNAPVFLAILAALGLIPLRTRAALWSWFMLVFNVGAILLGTNAFPTYNVRNCILAVPAFGLLLGLALGAGVRRKINPAPLLILWMALGVWNALQPPKDFTVGSVGPSKAEFQQVYHLLNQCTQVGDKAIFKLDWDGSNKWWDDLLHFYMPDARFPFIAKQVIREHDTDTIKQGLFLLDAQRLWFVRANYLPDYQEVGEFEQVLGSDFERCPQSLHLQDLTVNLYARWSADGQSTACPPPPTISTLDALVCAPQK